MESEKAREVSERDQFWASLRALQPEIDRLAAGDLDDSQRHRELVRLLARIVSSELDYRQRFNAAEED